MVDESTGGTDSTEQGGGGDARRELARGMVHLHKEFYGKGPTHAKSYINDDMIVILMRGGFTRVEQTLLEGGQGEAVIQQRIAFQEVMRPRFEQLIWEITGRTVVAFMSGSHQDPDVLAETFILDTTDLFEEPDTPVQ
jgi:uncharacterized protein YbcI